MYFQITLFKIVTLFLMAATLLIAAKRLPSAVIGRLRTIPSS
jgi:hypothetical protein